MTYSSSLDDHSSPLILDTSVLINLRASTYGARVLSALPHDVLVSQIAAAELEHDTSKNNGEHHFIQQLVASGKVRLIGLNECEHQVYETLVSGSPSLGDGEAATIALAACRNYLAVIDERKGRLRAQEHCGGRLPGWSLDVFRHPHVVAILGATASINALYFALRNGRMRIHEDHCDHVVALIGVQRALECNSLPGYKIRRQTWNAQASSESSKVV